MTNKIMFSTDYVGVQTVGLYYTTTDPEFRLFQTSPDIEVGIVTASEITAIGTVSASQFIGTVTGTASSASFASTAFNLEGSPSINVGIVTATGGFISSASTTPIQINFDSGANSITFSIAGIGTASLVLS